MTWRRMQVGSALGSTTTRRPLRCRRSVAGGKRPAGCVIQKARKLVITADGGASNGSRVRLWKRELQRLANEIGIAIEVHHLPPGPSKWNKIEHRLFSFISLNWRARPLVSYRVILDPISAPTTKTGLTVQCELDRAIYPTGIAVADEEIDALNIVRTAFRGKWNSTIRPNNRSAKAVDS